MAHTVTMSLSDEAYEVWKAFPKGTRSPSIAALLVDAERLRTQNILIENLKNECRRITNEKNKLNLQIANLEAFGVKE